MTEELPNVAEEIQREETVQPQESHETAETDSDKEYNFRQLRESKKQLEEEMQRLRAEMEGLKQPEAPPKEEEIGDDDLVEGRHVKQLYQKVTSYINQKEAEAIPDRLRTKFDDFDSVVSPQNVEKLKKLEPELYRTIVSGDDLYAKGVAAYKTLRSLGYGNPDNYSEAKKDLSRKASKPLTAQAVGSAALHEAGMFANGLTPELKKQLLAEMNQAAKAR